MSESVWSKEKLYFNQDDYFRDLVANIDSARQSIEMETYIFERGVLAERMSAALIRAKHRGLRVRLLIDGVGSPNFVTDYDEQLRASGIEVQFYRIWPWIFRHLPGEPRGFWARVAYRFARLNKGNHRKMCLIDQKTLWVGSANISDVHLREVNGDKAWLDLGVCVEGDDVAIAKRAFDQAYRRGLAPRLKFRLPKLLTFNQTFFQKRRQRARQFQRLKNAKERIWIQTPYFVPLGRVMRRLRKKLKEGVDVRVLVPIQSDVWLIPWISFPYLHRLAMRGAKIYEFQPRFLHQKLYLVDDWICLGSTNLNHRSFLHDLEMDVVITHPENKRALEENFLQDVRNSRPFDDRVWSTFPIWKRLFYRLFAYFSYWS